MPKKYSKTSFKKAVEKIAKKTCNKTVEVKQRSSTYEETSLNTLTQNVRGHTPFALRGGTNEDERIGNSANAIGISIRGHYFNNSASVPSMVRMLVVQDIRAPGSNITGAELLIKNNTPVGQNQGAESMYLPINKKRFRVYYDKTTMLSANVPQNTGQYRQFRKYLKLNHKLEFMDETAESITRNDIRVIFFAAETSSDEGLGNTVELYSNVVGYYRDN